MLALTGAEALYADMVHFGARPIRRAWFWIVLPALALNYFGQSALVLGDSAAAKVPFYLLVPNWGLYPMIGLATIATVIASQAVISGTFSLTRQAVQLGYCPRLEVHQTSKDEYGQIYMPRVNWGLMLAIIILVVGFRSSDALAAAYGIAVTGTMLITTVLAFVVARRIWGWPVLACVALVAIFLVVTALISLPICGSFSTWLVSLGDRGTRVSADGDMEKGAGDPGPAPSRVFDRLIRSSQVKNQTNRRAYRGRPCS